MRPLQARAERLKSQVQAELDAITALESQIALIRKTLEAFPGLRADFAEELRLLVEMGTPDVNGDDSEEEEEGAGRKQTVASQLIEFFRRNDNQPATVNEIAEETGLRVTTIQSQLYKADRNRKRFVSAKLHDGVGWHLAAPVAEDLWLIGPVCGKKAESLAGE